jgi:hypothetical protein
MGERAADSGTDRCPGPVVENVVTDQNPTQASLVLNPAVPIAQMLPRHYITTTDTAGPSTSNYNQDQAMATKSRPARTSSKKEAASGSDDERSFISPGRPAIKRRYTSGLPPTLTKKQMKAPARDFVPDLEAPAFRTRLQTRGEVDNIEDSYAYTSPPHTSADEDDTVNFPNIPNTEQSGKLRKPTTRGGFRSDTAATVQEASTSAGPSVEDTIAIDIRDHGSTPITVNTERESNSDARPSKKSPAKAKGKPRRVVTVKLSAQSEGVTISRRRLASKLWDVLPQKLGRPNIQLLSSTVGLLDTLIKQDYQRLMEMYDDCTEHINSFKLWMQCLELLVQFYESTGFTGNLTTWDDFLKNLPGGLPDAASRGLSHKSAALDKLRADREVSGGNFATEVASVLFHLVSSPNRMSLPKLEQLVPDFTEELVAWYDQ